MDPALFLESWVTVPIPKKVKIKNLRLGLLLLVLRILAGIVLLGEAKNGSSCCWADTGPEAGRYANSRPQIPAALAPNPGSPFPSGSKRAGNATRIVARKETKAAARQALDAVLLDARGDQAALSCTAAAIGTSLVVVVPLRGTPISASIAVNE